MSSSFLVDTNVLSELMRSQPDVHVLEWFDAHIDAQCFTSSVTKAEIFLGIALLPEGSRQTQLAKAAVKMFAEDFSDRCLSFDDNSALKYAELVSQRTRAGKPVSTEDAQIAAIALSENLTLLTRNIKDFIGIDGLKLANPWLIT